MKRYSLGLILLCAAPFCAIAQHAPTPPAAAGGNMVLIKGGEYQPLYAKAAAKRSATSCFMSIKQVTNGEFLEFVRKHPEWQRSKVDPALADKNYLSHWTGDTDLGKDAEKIASRPVTNVSWYAARAYAHAAGCRLPTQDEWEFVARADAKNHDATGDKEYLKKLLDWYSRPVAQDLESCDMMEANVYGVRGMHGVVWEWVHDFNTTLIVGDSRGDGSLERNLFCGASSLLASDVSNYAAFMRYALRSSLRGNFCLGSLGFRVVKSDGKDPEIISQKFIDAKTPYELKSDWTDSHKNVLKLASFAGKIRIVTMGFTSCKYACPRIVGDMKRVESGLGADAARVGFAFISIDPTVDTPEKMALFLKEHQLDETRWTTLTGTKESVQDLSIVMNYQYQEVNGEFAHSNLIAVLNEKGQIIHRMESLGGDVAPTIAAVKALLATPAKTPEKP
jgi:formylglycine-generating enzyme required for sulfatase activity